MALFDFLKKKEKEQKAASRGATRGTKSKSAKEEKSAEDKSKPRNVVLKESREAWRVLREPHVTERATNLTAFNQYVFKLSARPSKPEIKRAIEEVYGVHVEAVQKISIPRKKRRRGKYIGWKPGYTKAIVRLKKGESIEVLPH